MNKKDRLPTERTHMLKARLIRESGNKCNGCGFRFLGHPHQLSREEGAVELDHKIPLSKGGSNALFNLQVLCLPCHDGKSENNLTDEEWLRIGRPQNWTRKNAILGRRRQNTSSRKHHYARPEHPPRRQNPAA